MDMPLVFEKDGFRFAFYSNDHRPIHVHVRKAGAEAIFDVGGRSGVARVSGIQNKGPK